MARKYHPDVNKAKDAAEKFKEATEAHEVLSDTDKRKMYDRFGHVGPQAGPQGQTYRWAGGPREAGSGFEEFFAGGASPFMGMGLQEILEALSGRRPSSRAAATGGQDIECPLKLDFMQAVKGITATIRVPRPGKGKSGGPETLEVKIPPGVKDGARIRLRGKGHASRGGPGDLYIKVGVRPHGHFRREGSDIHLDLPISITEAALGARVDVPTIDGVTTVTIPPGTSGGQRLRLRGKGVASPGKPRGNQYITVRLVVPKKLSAAAKKLLAQLHESQPFDPREEAPWTM